MIATIEPIPAFSDNYLWLIHDGAHAVVVDPGDGTVVLNALAARNLVLSAILVTHHHPDHVGGIPALLARYDVPVYGPRAEAGTIKRLSQLLDDGDRVRIPLLDLEFEILAVPGHTLGHIAYRGEIPAALNGSGQARKVLFCGDTLFVGGCGRLFEGTPQQMHHSLSKLASLPPETEVFCAHEYTLTNLAFAQAVEPASDAVAADLARVRALRAGNRPSVPSSIGHERSINPFLRCDQVALAASVAAHAGRPIDDPAEVFAELRRWKDEFRPPVV